MSSGEAPAHGEVRDRSGRTADGGIGAVQAPAIGMACVIWLIGILVFYTVRLGGVITDKIISGTSTEQRLDWRKQIEKSVLFFF
jgi:hypothetical protein